MRSRLSMDNMSGYDEGNIPPTHTMNTIIIQPHFLQWIINQLPLILLVFSGIMLYGVEDCGFWIMENTLFRSIVFWITVFFSLQLLYSFIYIRCLEYRITDQQIIIEHGVLHRNTDYMELYRVIDFNEHRNIMQQLCALKSITIYAGDRNMPTLNIIGVKNHYDLSSELRQRVIYSREIHHIYEVTNRI